MKTSVWWLLAVTIALLVLEFSGVASIPWPVHGYLVVSVVTLGTYTVDKRRAGKGGRRIRERTLHLLELAGGWPGGLLGQQLLRHKNRKLGYQAVFWLIVLIHAVFWAWWFFGREGA